MQVIQLEEQSGSDKQAGLHDPLQGRIINKLTLKLHIVRI